MGSKALNLKQAVLIATVCEFLGAFLMGSSTADTIKGGLIDVDLFAAQPELLMLGMVCSLVGSFTWVLFASSRGWPVSTTHAIVGTITGIGLAGFGGSAVHWVEIGKIVSSWLISPLCAGLVCRKNMNTLLYFYSHLLTSNVLANVLLKRLYQQHAVLDHSVHFPSHHIPYPSP